MNYFRNLSAGAAICLAIAGSVGTAQAEELRIGTASLGGAFYPVGQAAANLVTKYADDYTMVPVVTQGATENPRLIASGEVDIAIGNANSSYFAYKGTDPYSEPLDIRSVGTLHDSALHIVTLAGSDRLDLPAEELAVELLGLGGVGREEHCGPEGQAGRGRSCRGGHLANPQ